MHFIFTTLPKPNHPYRYATKYYIYFASVVLCCSVVYSSRIISIHPFNGSLLILYAREYQAHFQYVSMQHIICSHCTLKPHHFLSHITSWLIRKNVFVCQMNGEKKYERNTYTHHIMQNKVSTIFPLVSTLSFVFCLFFFSLFILFS